MNDALRPGGSVAPRAVAAGGPGDALLPKQTNGVYCEMKYEVSIMKITAKRLLEVSAATALLVGLGATAPLLRAADTQTIKGEVVDLMCYLDHGAKGDKHAGCAKKCIESGGPVGILTADNQLYLVIGDHKPINETLAPLAAKTVTVKGKVVERDGMKMIENCELEK